MRPEVLDPSKQGLPDYMGKKLLAFVTGLSTLEGLEGLVDREVLEDLESLEGHGGWEPLVMVVGTVVAVGGVGSLLLQGDEGTAEGDIDDAVGVHKDADQEVPREVVPHRVAWQPAVKKRHSQLNILIVTLNSCNVALQQLFHYIKLLQNKKDRRLKFFWDTDKLIVFHCNRQLMQI